MPKNIESTDFRGHLPPPFYAANDEGLRWQYLSEPKFPGQMNETGGNYGVGGYYGTTYQQYERKREIPGTSSRNTGYPDTYRRLGDRRWSDADTSWETERSERPGYNSMTERARYGEGHRGKGPRSYRRSDERIQEDINDRMYDDPYLDATDIEMTVREGEVILAGTVESRQAKRRAEDIAEAVYGVRNVENRLRIKPNV